MAESPAIQDRHPLVARVGLALRAWRGIGPGILVAVSGGGDSVGLLRILAELAPELDLILSVAHLDHGVRGDEARADANFVAELAESLRIPFDLGHWTPTKAGGFEAEARQARYAWLLDVAEKRGASSVAVGHTRDDQAETILHRIIRGTGSRGLAGMPARRALSASVTLIRPMLGCRREDVRRYLDKIGQPHRHDFSNDDITKTRARIRLDLMPKLASEYNPNVADALARLGRLAGEDLKRAARRVDKAGREAIIGASAEEGVVLLRESLDRLSPGLRAEVIRLAWRRAGWPERGMDEARWLRLAGLDPSFRGRFSVGGGIDAWVSDELIRLAPKSSAADIASPGFARLPIPGFARWLDGRVGAWIGEVDPVDESVDLDQIRPFSGGFLVVSPPSVGDRFSPLGMGGKAMALADFLRGRKVPISDRGRIPVVRDSLGILWVAGHRIADRVKRTEGTTRRLGLRWEPGMVALTRP